MTVNNIFPEDQRCWDKIIPENDKTIGIPNSDLHIYVIHSLTIYSFFTYEICAIDDFSKPLPGVRFALI